MEIPSMTTSIQEGLVMNYCLIPHIFPDIVPELSIISLYLKSTLNIIFMLVKIISQFSALFNSDSNNLTFLHFSHQKVIKTIPSKCYFNYLRTFLLQSLTRHMSFAYYRQQFLSVSLERCLI